MKFLFYSIEDLNALVTNIYKKNDNELYMIGFSEELDTDVVEYYKEGSEEITDLISFEEIILYINKQFNIEVTKYDVTEIHDGEVGFLFYF